MIHPNPVTIYEAAPGFEAELTAELTCANTPDHIGGLLYAVDAPVDAVWYQNRWDEPFTAAFASIGEAAAILRSRGRNWVPALFTQFRRGALIQAKLPPLPHRPRPFPWTAPTTPLGAWTMLDKNHLVGSAQCASPFPGGVLTFEEDTQGPPSRAYLKLWEALVRLRTWPRPGDRCLDAGASPGGWTWAAAQLGATVTAVDRAALEPRISALPGVTWVRHDAFTIRPQDIGPMDWVLGDVACYPARLYEWVTAWLASGLCKNYVCTIKFQGPPTAEQQAITRAFAALPGQVVHLHHNKHELTWMYGGAGEEY